MQEIDKIIRAWKDDDYLMSLSTDERQALPKNPAGLVEFSGADLNRAARIFSLSGVLIFTMCCTVKP
jgi:mersacidin/lichenicidin family type 2 lantibiotic